ncbi:tetratricopeptide repeat protein [Polynucleobacter sp. MWH-UH24A]|uniref:tetratricopeptide repeat protein n=1 Tax=Polynucleobacter sp. MWH-UH24A TaxID=2689110 RepID=UPI001BFD3127|nr:tetratricopeptide repeat protein [Polynucleobacter sp. MWH-UH24A]QWD76216.1 tetratricopeptide repeat protein [Polynucleobacter sp. MWH-UH24A]
MNQAFQQAFFEHQNGNYDVAKRKYESVLSSDPNHFEALYFLGLLYAELTQFEQAKTFIQQAVSINPAQSDAWNHLGLVLYHLRDYSNAEAAYNKSLAINQENIEALLNYAVLQSDQKKTDEAKEKYKKIITLNPNHFLAYLNLGNLYQEQKDEQQAMYCYYKAQEINPEDLRIHNNIGLLHYAAGRYEEAKLSYERALRIDPECEEAWYNFGELAYQMTDYALAEHCYSEVEKIDAENIQYKLVKTMNFLRKFYTNSLQIDEQIKKFENSLDVILKKQNVPDEKIIAVNQPFYLAYTKDNRVNLYRKIGKLWGKLVGTQNLRKIEHTKTKSKEKINVIFIGSHFYNHSVWNAITRGFIEKLDKDKFEIYVIDLGEKEDDQTEIAKKFSIYIKEKNSTDVWINKIIKLNPDVIIYPELGMHKETTQLAIRRLANLQCVMWGHPETTGIETIDSYISSELMESGEAQENYTENLIKLKNLGVYLFNDEFPKQCFDIAELKIETNKKIIICPGLEPKYHPDFDLYIREIAKIGNNIQIIFFVSDKYVSNKIQDRLIKNLQISENKFNEIIKFIPNQPIKKFNYILSISHLCLDTIYFSGFNTALASLKAGTPIVTSEGTLLRENLASGILKRAGLDELCANSKKEYIEIVQKLLIDESFYKKIKCKIFKSSCLFLDEEPIREFENFVIAHVNK